MKSHKALKRVLSLFLILIIIVFSFVTISVSAATTLNASNVVTWPTISYKNADGKMYYGQTQEEALIINDDEVVQDANGNVVDGYFVFSNPSQIPSAGTRKATITFVPANEDEYTGFKKSFSSVTYTVEAVTPSYVDEVNDPVVATEVDAGALLSTSILSGGEMTNPYNPEEPNLLKAKWVWSNKNEPSTTVVTESGYYTAQFAAAEYNAVIAQVYVKVKVDIPLSVIETTPSVEFTYDPNLTWGEVSFKGGKAIIKDTTTEVEGTFSVSDSIKKDTPTVGTYNIPVIFTPDDETVALPVEFECPVTVNKAVPKFKTDDESGVPTVTMPYGTKLNSSLDSVIKPLVDVDVPVYLAYKDLNGEDLSYSNTVPLVGTHEIQVRVNIDNSNYEQYTMLTFMLEITGFEANCIMQPVGSEGYKIIDTSFKYDAEKPKGTFTVSYTVAGEKQPDITVKYGSLFQVDETKSGIYEFSITYNQVENDPFEIADFTMSIEKKLSRNVNIGDSSEKYTYGDKVTAVAPATDPAKPDKPYYGFSGWNVKGNIGLSDEELKNTEISFYMPDEDVELNATYKFSIKLFFEWLWQQIVQFFTFIINAVKDLFALATTA